MDVRIKLGPAGDARKEEQEILTGLPDGSLRTLFNNLLARHPELETAIHKGDLDQELLDILINNQRLENPHLGDYRLKDGDTVSLHIRHGSATSS